MKKLSLLAFSCLFSSLSFAQQATPEIAIIPEPVKITRYAGMYTLPQAIIVQAGSQQGMNPVLDLIRQKFSTATGKMVLVRTDAPGATIKLVLNKKTDNTIGKEGYYLSVKTTGITITANQPAGLYYGAQTLM